MKINSLHALHFSILIILVFSCKRYVKVTEAVSEKMPETEHISSSNTSNEQSETEDENNSGPISTKILATFLNPISSDELESFAETTCNNCWSQVKIEKIYTKSPDFADHFYPTDTISLYFNFGYEAFAFDQFSNNKPLPGLKFGDTFSTIIQIDENGIKCFIYEKH